MPEPTAQMLVAILTAYAGLGFLFALAFVTRGVGRVDPLAHVVPWTFRLLIMPGTIVCWPLLLVRWVNGSGAPPVEFTAHRLRATRRS